VRIPDHRQEKILSSDPANVILVTLPSFAAGIQPIIPFGVQIAVQIAVPIKADIVNNVRVTGHQPLLKASMASVFITDEYEEAV